MTEYLVRLFYLGHQYHGSQYQHKLKTVQGELIKAISCWSGEPHSSKSVRFSGRTDRGVHSLGQLVQISTKIPLNIDKINKHLPPDIIIWASAESPAGFQPRYDALFRHYRYHPGDTWDDVDLERVKRAVELLVGCNDFCLVSKPDGNRNTVTTILNMALVNTSDGFYLDLFGTSFLWKFVRKAVTLLHRVGIGELEPSAVEMIIQGNRHIIPSGIKPAPPEGLVLIETVVPVIFRKSKHALRTIRTLLTKEFKFHKRSMHTLESVFTFFSA